MVVKEGDLVWIRLEKERFLARYFKKLCPKANGCLKVINDNAYKINLLCDYIIYGL